MDNKFSKLIEGEKCVYKHAKGTAATPSREFHNYHELILFIGGKTTFLSEEKRISLPPYQIIVIPKETYHQFLNENDEEYHRCVFSFYDIPELYELTEKCMRSIKVFDASNEQRMLFSKLNDIQDSDCTENEKQILMYSLLALVLNEVARDEHDVKEGSKPSEITTKCIEVIDSLLCEKFTVAELAKELNVSISTLTQTFKRDMNISVYQYILRKKLTMAQQRIREGESATTAALQCGFNDYSGFYKQYKKMFGVSPSERSTSF